MSLHFFFSHPWKHINYFFYPVTLFIFPCLKRRGKKIILPENSITLGITKEKKSYSHMKKKTKTFPCFFLSFLFFSPFFLFYLFSQIELGKIIFAKTLFTSSWVINTGEVTISIFEKKILATLTPVLFLCLLPLDKHIRLAHKRTRWMYPCSTHLWIVFYCEPRHLAYDVTESHTTGLVI